MLNRELNLKTIPALASRAGNQRQLITVAGLTMTRTSAQRGQQRCRVVQTSLEPVQVRPWPFSFEHGDLLSEGEDFESGIAPTANENSEG